MAPACLWRWCPHRARGARTRRVGPGPGVPAPGRPRARASPAHAGQRRRTNAPDLRTSAHVL